MYLMTIYKMRRILRDYDKALIGENYYCGNNLKGVCDEF